MAPSIDIPRLLAETFATRVEHHAELGSTNDRARELASATPRESVALVVADRQTAGRGRGSNRWWTGEGSLAFSLLFDPALCGVERKHFGMLALAAAVGIVETVAPLLPDHTSGLHWPNDVFVGDRKLAGILVEALPDGRHVVGIGVNVNNSLASAPEELLSLATTLGELTGAAHERTELLVRLLDHLASNLDVLGRQPQELGRRADELCLQHGRTLTLRHGGRTLTGLCAGIAPDGALLLDTPSGREAFYSGVLVKA